MTAVSAGSAHSLAVQNGAAVAWGSGNSGRLGNGGESNSSVPVAVVGLPDGVIDVAAGRSTSFALTGSGRLFAWGSNAGGEFGDGTTTSSRVPVEVFAPAGFFFSDIDCGSFHVVAILTPVPEPAGLLAAAGLALAAGRRLRRAGYPFAIRYFRRIE